jgi:hypothetical protein
MTDPRRETYAGAITGHLWAAPDQIDDATTAVMRIADTERQQAEAAIDRVRAVLAERRTEVAEREADGMLPFGTPGASWCDAVTVTCARVEDALRTPAEPQGVPVLDEPAPARTRTPALSPLVGRPFRSLRQQP